MYWILSGISDTFLPSILLEGRMKEVHEVSVTLIQDIRSWIFFPAYVEFFA